MQNSKDEHVEDVHLENNLGYLLNKSSRMLRWELNYRLQEHGLTSAQWSVLIDLYMQEKQYQDKDVDVIACTPAAISQRLFSDRPTISGILYRLNNNGWISSHVNPNDRRSQLICLTPKAKTLIPELIKVSEQVMVKAVAGFNESEVVVIHQFLKRIISNLSN